MKKVTIAVILLAVIAVLIQFRKVERTNPETDPAMTINAQMGVPPDVNALLVRACNDCHSNSTVWPWYSSVAPVSWLVAEDVVNGRKHLNFSEWGKYKDTRREQKLSQIAQVVSEKEMPLFPYTVMHSEAKLTDAERKLLSDWADRSYKMLFGEEEK